MTSMSSWPYLLSRRRWCHGDGVQPCDIDIAKRSVIDESAQPSAKYHLLIGSGWGYQRKNVGFPQQCVHEGRDFTSDHHSMLGPANGFLLTGFQWVKFGRKKRKERQGGRKKKWKRDRNHRNPSDPSMFVAHSKLCQASIAHNSFVKSSRQDPSGPVGTCQQDGQQLGLHSSNSRAATQKQPSPPFHNMFST